MKFFNIFNKKQDEIVKDDFVLNQHKVNLEKTINDNSFNELKTHKAKVVVVLDYSGSMRPSYNSGSVQKVLTKLFPVSLKFDDDGELEVYLFSNGFKKLKNMNIENYSNYVSNIIYKSKFEMGGTEYYPVIEEISNNLNKDIPTFVIFITDGDNYVGEKEKTIRLIREISDKNIFIQFVGIGNDKFTFLEQLDDLENRTCDNTGFEKFKDLANKDDLDVYDKILRQYNNWLLNK